MGAAFLAPLQPPIRSLVIPPPIPHLQVFSRPTLLADSLWIPYGVSAAGVRAACEEATQLREGAPLSAVFCHADVIGGLMNENVRCEGGVPPDAFPPPPTLVYSGHYHKPHVLESRVARGRTIRYVGSPYQERVAHRFVSQAQMSHLYIYIYIYIYI